MTETMSADQVRVKWGDVITATLRGESTIVERYGKPVSVVVPFEQWQRIQNAHIEELKRRRREEEQIPWEEVKAGMVERGLID